MEINKKIITIKIAVKNTTKNCKKHKSLLVISLFTLAFYITFNYAPMYGVIIAFKQYMVTKGIIGSPWVGFDNFRILFNSYDFFRIFRNTLIISFLNLAIVFPASIIFALLINEIASYRYKRIVQTISYLPHFLSWIVCAGIFMEVLSPNRGILNYILIQLKIINEPIYFLANNSWFRMVLVGTNIWQSVGWGSIIYIASIGSIDAALYEASFIDGSNRFQNAMYITIPSILPIITITFILQVGRLMNTSFDQIYNLYNPMVYETADTFDTYVYRIGLEQFRYSYATAVGLFKNIVGLFLLVTSNRLLKHFSEYTLW